MSIGKPTKNGFFPGISTRLWVSGMGRPFQLSTFIMDFLERELVLNIPGTSRFFFFFFLRTRKIFKKKTIASKMHLLHGVSCCVCLGFLWLTFVHKECPHIQVSTPMLAAEWFTSIGWTRRTHFVWHQATDPPATRVLPFLPLGVSQK